MKHHPSFPELATTSLPELFEQAWTLGNQKILAVIASRWHDPNCGCKFKDATEVKTCLRCENVRRAVRERL